jgi:hypothetical protein
MSDSEATRLAPWIRQMPLDAQLLITGSTLILADIKERAESLPADLDEVRLREDRDPRRAAGHARALARVFTPHQSESQDMARIVSLTTAVADKIDEYFPG